MRDPHSPAFPDLVIDMQEMGVGVPELLSFARGALTDAERLALVSGIEQMLAQAETSEARPGLAKV